MFFWIISSVIIYTTHTQYTYCNDYKECANEPTITSRDWIYCDASFACDSASTISTGAYVLCHGSRACADIPNIQYDAGRDLGFALCGGLESCSDSVLSMKNVRCTGSKACSEATINNAASVSGRGTYSLLNAWIVADNTDIDIQLYGHNAGYGTRISCIGSSFCEIMCGGTGCSNISIDGSGQWNVSYLSQDTTTVNMENGGNVVPLDATQNDAQCAQTFDVYKERYSGQDITAVGTDTICCRGSESCRETRAILMSNNVLLCSGYLSCMSIAKIQGEYANIMCSGYWSCSYSKIWTKGDTYCSGFRGCWHSNITTSGNIHCSAWSGCLESTIYITPKSVSSIFLSGEQSGDSVSIYCLSDAVCSVYCQGKAACSDVSILDCTEGHCDVYCTMDTGCPDVYSSNRTQEPLSYCSVTNATYCDVTMLSFEQDIYCCSYILGLETNDIISQQQLYQSIKLVKDLNVASLACDWCFVVIACVTFYFLAKKYDIKTARYVPLFITLLGSLLDVCITFSIVAIIDQNALIDSLESLYTEKCYSTDLDATLFELKGQFETILILDVTEGVIDLISICILFGGKFFKNEMIGSCTEGIHAFMFIIFDLAIITVNVVVFVLPAYNVFTSTYNNNEYSCFQKVTAIM